MHLKLAVVIQPSKEVLQQAINAANQYTKKNYNKTSQFIRYIYPEQVVFRVPHITLRGSSLIKGSEIPEFLHRIESIARKHKPFQVVLDGTKSFIHNGKTTVHYWYVEPSSKLKSLYEELRAQLDPKWKAAYHEEYNPHLTLTVDETEQSPLSNSKPIDLPRVVSTIDKITILYRLPEAKQVSYQKIYSTIKLGSV